MTPEQRRDWRKRVFGHPDLTLAHQIVLLALETFADYSTGANARPGQAVLAEMCGVKERAVRYALARGQRLGLIERTSPANSKRGLADVYRLTTTGTAMPVVTQPTTGTAMPVEEITTGTAMHHDRHGDNSTTGTAVPPTFPGPFQDRGAREPEAVAEASERRPYLNGSTPRPSEKSANSNTVQRPRCARHRRIVSDADVPNCPECRDIRNEQEAEQRRAVAEANAQTIRDCRLCDDYAWLLGADETPLEPSIKCNHTEEMEQIAWTHSRCPTSSAMPSPSPTPTHLTTWQPSSPDPVIPT